MSFRLFGKALCECPPRIGINNNGGEDRFCQEDMPVGCVVLGMFRLMPDNLRKYRRQKMNRWTGVGTLPRAAVLSGNNKKVLKFTLCTILGFNNKTRKARRAYVPCAVFGPNKSLIQMLTEHHNGMLISAEGRIGTSKYQTQDGQTRYTTQVVVDPASITSVNPKKNEEAKEQDVA